MLNKYLNKWVAVRRTPCSSCKTGEVIVIYVKEETTNQIRGIESTLAQNFIGYLRHFHKNQIIEIVNKDEAKLIRTLNKIIKNEFKAKIKDIEAEYQKKIINILV